MKVVKAVYRETGQRIRKNRLKLHLTQEYVSEMINVSLRQYKRYESGETPLTMDTLYDFEDLGFDIHYIATGITEADYRMWRCLSTISDEEYNQFCEIIEKVSYSLSKENIIRMEDELKHLDDLLDSGILPGRVRDIPRITFETDRIYGECDK